MKWLSYNCRGLASPSKRLTLKRLLSCDPCDIIFLQETLASSNQIVRTLLSILLGWHFQTLDATGRSGGLALWINPRSIKVTSAWGGRGFLGMDVFSAKMGRNLHIVNIYALNHNRLDFWQQLL